MAATSTPVRPSAYEAMCNAVQQSGGLNSGSPGRLLDDLREQGFVLVPLSEQAEPDEF